MRALTTQVTLILFQLLSVFAFGLSHILLSKTKEYRVKDQGSGVSLVIERKVNKLCNRCHTIVFFWRQPASMSAVSPQLSRRDPCYK